MKGFGFRSFPVLRVHPHFTEGSCQIGSCLYGTGEGGGTRDPGLLSFRRCLVKEAGMYTVLSSSLSDELLGEGWEP